jgi:large subunit ribosomal protein L22
MTKGMASKTESKQLVKASARYLHISPRKMRLVTNLIKNMNVADALVQLDHLDKKAAPMVVKLLSSAVANAKHNFSYDPEKLYIKSITADQGPVLKRYFPRARGSAFVIRRKLCHVNIVLEEKAKGKTGSSRLSFLKRAAKSEDKAAENVDQQAATSAKAPKEEGRKPQIFKSEEQVKQSKAQQKRRLFNRKSGE